MGLQLAQRLREAADGHRASTATASGADRRLNLAALLWSHARTRVWGLVSGNFLAAAARQDGALYRKLHNYIV